MAKYTLTINKKPRMEFKQIKPAITRSYMYFARKVQFMTTTEINNHLIIAALSWMIIYEIILPYSCWWYKPTIYLRFLLKLRQNCVELSNSVKGPESRSLSWAIITTFNKLIKHVTLCMLCVFFLCCSNKEKNVFYE